MREGVPFDELRIFEGTEHCSTLVHMKCGRFRRVRIRTAYFGATMAVYIDLLAPYMRKVQLCVRPIYNEKRSRKRQGRDVIPHSSCGAKRTFSLYRIL